MRRRGRCPRRPRPGWRPRRRPGPPRRGRRRRRASASRRARSGATSEEGGGHQEAGRGGAGRGVGCDGHDVGTPGKMAAASPRPDEEDDGGRAASTEPQAGGPRAHRGGRWPGWSVAAATRTRRPELVDARRPVRARRTGPARRRADLGHHRRRRGARRARGRSPGRPHRRAAPLLDGHQGDLGPGGPPPRGRRAPGRALRPARPRPLDDGRRVRRPRTDSATTCSPCSTRSAAPTSCWPATRWAA